MQDDWKPGDLALCVRDEDEGPTDPSVPEIKVGDVRTVRDSVIVNGWCPHAGYVEGLYLSFMENDPDHGYHSERFKKIDPLTEEEEREFKADLDADRIRETV